MKKISLNKYQSTWTRTLSEKSGNDWSVEDELLDFLYGFVRLTKPFKILEIGTFEGMSSVYMAKALSKNNQGMIFTYDIKDFGQKKLIEDNKLSERVICTISDANNILSDFSEKNQNIFDMAFIDDGHSYEDASRDLEICHKLIMKNGYILGHDILAIPTVQQAFNDFLGKYKNLYEKIIIASYCGIFILKRIA